MLFDYLYILNNYDPAFFNGEPAGDFMIPVNASVLRDHANLFQTLFRSNSRFCFAVSDNIAGADRLFIQTEIVRNFVRLLFLPNYLRSENRHLFFIDPATGNREALLNFGNLLREEFGKQGINIMLVDALAPAGATGADEQAIMHNSLNGFLAGENTQADFETFTSAFWLPPHFEKKWIISVSSPADLCKKKKQLEKFELWLKGTHSAKVELIEMVSAAAVANNALRAENKLLSFKLENSANYLKLIREESMGLIHEIGKLRSEGQRGIPAGDAGMEGYVGDFELVAHYQRVLLEERKRADDTFNWYQKEYEVLPGWFKKIGQFIRVLMGKRSFPSLFNKSKNEKGKKNSQ